MKIGSHISTPVYTPDNEPLGRELLFQFAVFARSKIMSNGFL